MDKWINGLLGEMNKWLIKRNGLLREMAY